MKHAADLELARRAAQADPSAFGALFADCFDRVYPFVRRRSPTREAAERATDRILAGAFAQLAGYDGSTSFSAWLLGIVKRELRDGVPTSRAALSGGAPLTESGA